MILAAEQARLLEIALPVCDRYRVALAGGHAVQAHGVVTRPSQDLDLVTGESTPVEEITEALADAYQRAGWDVARRPGGPLMTQLLVTPPSRPTSVVNLLKEPLGHPPVRIDLGLPEPVPVVDLQDSAAMKLAALADRAVPRDLIDVHGLSAHFSQAELLTMAASFDEEFRPRALAERLKKLADLDDEEYLAYGLEAGRVQGIKRWALAWAQDIELDLMEGREDPDSFYDPYDETE